MQYTNAAIHLQNLNDNIKLSQRCAFARKIARILENRSPISYRTLIAYNGSVTVWSGSVNDGK